MDAIILQALERNTAAVHKLIAIMEAKENPSPWVDPEEAAKILGLNITARKEHRKRINLFINKGLIKTFIPGKPYRYSRRELTQLAEAVAKGDLAYPTTR